MCKAGQTRMYTPYMTVFSDFPAYNTVYALYLYGFGQR
jgi:hypothetical protein